MTETTHENLAHAHGGPPLTGVLRKSPEDFHVTEQLGFDADGDGDQVMLSVRKRGLTTQQAADALARFAGVKPLDVGYAGMKDRHAVTEQAFTVKLAGREAPDWQAMPRQDLEVLAQQRHRRKLKPGALQGNAFRIVLREVAGDRARAGAVLQAMARRGVPNYYGEQRFGRWGDNLDQARTMFAGRRVKRRQRGILLSATRSWLFNAVLHQRVQDERWDRALAGEIFCLHGSRAWFGPEPMSDALQQRLDEHDIHPSGPLWGRGDTPAAEQAADIERAIAGAHADLVSGLTGAGLEHDRRALRLIPTDMRWQWLAEDALELSFSLPAGGYATSLMRELATTQDAARS